MLINPPKLQGKALLNSHARISKTAAAIVALGELLRAGDLDQGLELSASARDGLGCLLELVGDELFDLLDCIPATLEELNKLNGEASHE